MTRHHSMPLARLPIRLAVFGVLVLIALLAIGTIDHHVMARSNHAHLPVHP